VDYNNKYITYIAVVILIVIAVSLFGGWRNIKFLQGQRDILKEQNEKLKVEYSALSDTLRLREKRYKEIVKERKDLEEEISIREREIKNIDNEHEKDLIVIDNSDVNNDIIGVSDIFCNHDRR
jgi:septal ring factor EnvC (AmiA/AmiB activator)